MTTPAVLPRALRTALPLFAGQAVVLGSGFALNAALVAWVFKGDPAAMGRLGVLSEALQWITVVALMGMPAAVMRLAPARPAARGAILRTASVAAIVAALALAFVAPFPVPFGDLLVGHENTGLLWTYGFRAVPLCAIWVSTAALHAEGRLHRKAAVEGFERVAVLVCGLAGALLLQRSRIDGLLIGMLAGSCAAWGFAWTSFLRDPALADRSAAVPFRELLRIGAPQMAISLLESLRPLILLRIAQELVGGDALGHLATAKTFALPLVIAPELLAQALFPGMHGPAGEKAHVEGDRKRFIVEIAAAGVVVCAIYGGLAAWLLPAIGTGKYAGAVVPLLILLPGVLAQGATAHTGYVLLVRDRLGKAALVSVLALVVTVFLAALLVPGGGAVHGATGAALALSAGLVVRSALLLAFARQS
ncbi:MAG: hypothetical protein K8T90_13860 [Planctomycetes bacterium]|nr:hypothetical protein [Planctomycetota bacterium]